MDREEKRRLMIKLMNAESTLRNLGEYAEANNYDTASRFWTFLNDLDKETGEMADRLSDLTERARKLKEDM